jgi:cell division protease FtsH
VLQRDCSEQTAREIDEEVKSLLSHAYAKAKEILTEHRDQLEKVTAELLARETIDGPEFYKLVGREMPRPKEPVPTLPAAPAVAAAHGQPAARDASPAPQAGRGANAKPSP